MGDFLSDARLFALSDVECVAYYRAGNCFTADIVYGHRAPLEAARAAGFIMNDRCSAFEARAALEPVLERDVPAKPYAERCTFARASRWAGTVCAGGPPPVNELACQYFVPSSSIPSLQILQRAPACAWAFLASVSFSANPVPLRWCLFL